MIDIGFDELLMLFLGALALLALGAALYLIRRGAGVLPMPSSRRPAGGSLEPSTVDVPAARALRVARCAACHNAIAGEISRSTPDGHGGWKTYHLRCNPRL